MDLLDDLFEEEQEEDEAMDESVAVSVAASSFDSETILQLVKIYNSKPFTDLINKIDSFKNGNRDVALLSGNIEDDPEYIVILQANNLTVEIDNEILIAYKFIRDHYAPKFPELEQLIPSPLDYARAVKVIKNEMNMSTVDLKNNSNLPQATIMIVTMAATTTTGKPLPKEKLDRVLEAIDVMLSLEEAQKKIMGYVESRMNLIAPNLSAIIGSTTAAKLMAVAGGLTALTKIPSCNLQILGKTSKTNTGLSAIGQQRHVGFIYYSDLVSKVPSDYRKKVAKLVAAKCALAVRVDIARSNADGSAGKDFKADIMKKVEQLLEPPPGQSTKALPVPLEAPIKKRGGKRVRRQKEKMAVTEVRKQQNRMVFGHAEDEIETSMGSSMGLGLVGGHSGKIRATTADTRVKTSISKRHKTMLQQQSHVSGFETSLAFTPVKGLELGNPELEMKSKADKVKEANNKWFKS